jgi:hypothetical protein
MLASFSLANFKSYESAILPLAPLTVLVGANAAGTSNLIEAMQLLAWLASGRRLVDLSAAMKSGEMAIRGSLADLPLDRRHPMALGCTAPLVVGHRLEASDATAREPALEALLGGMLALALDEHLDDLEGAEAALGRGGDEVVEVRSGVVQPEAGELLSDRVSSSVSWLRAS